MAVRVRNVEQADLVPVGILAGRLVRMHHAWDPERFMKPGNPEQGYTWWFGTKLADPKIILLVAEEPEVAEGPLGYAFCALEGKDYNDLLEPHAKLHDILVDERAQRRGVGEALLTEVFRQAKEKGAPRVLLHTAAQNETAQRLFARMGFRTTMLEMTRELK